MWLLQGEPNGEKNINALKGLVERFEIKGLILEPMIR